MAPDWTLWAAGYRTGLVQYWTRPCHHHIQVWKCKFKIVCLETSLDVSLHLIDLILAFDYFLRTWSYLLWYGSQLMLTGVVCHCSRRWWVEGSNAALDQRNDGIFVQICFNADCVSGGNCRRKLCVFCIVNFAGCKRPHLLLESEPWLAAKLLKALKLLPLPSFALVVIGAAQLSLVHFSDVMNCVSVMWWFCPFCVAFCYVRCSHVAHCF